MLHRFIAENSELIIARSREKVAQRTAPRATEAELRDGVPMFLREFLERLRDHEDPAAASTSANASLHASELLAAGFTIGQVVYGYGDVCQMITGLMVELGTQMATTDFRTLNLCLDIAIAEAVTEYQRQREQSIAERGLETLGHLAHELRNLLNTATLAFEAIASGSVGVGGSTGRILGNSLAGMGDLVTRSLAEVRLEAGAPRRDRVVVSDLLGEVAIGAALRAKQRNVQLSFAPVASNIAVDGDTQIVLSIVTNLVQNACKFTRSGGHVTVSGRARAEWIAIDVADECGGLPAGKLEALFTPYDQRGADHSGLGLGLAISLKGARAIGGTLTARDVPGVGCVFTLELPRSLPA